MPPHPPLPCHRVRCRVCFRLIFWKGKCNVYSFKKKKWNSISFTALIQPSFSLHSGFIQPFLYDLVQMEWKVFSYYYQLILNTKNIMKFPCSAFQTRFMAFIWPSWPLIFFSKKNIYFFLKFPPTQLLTFAITTFLFKFILIHRMPFKWPLYGLYVVFGIKWGHWKGF